ncbi:MAG: 1-(5-phosphoribosyl)-5-[(5-phosphoribosylamino)methylideneamino]imidazole-4-carboxamide isomerase [Cellvibrionales bacterium]|nr:1-(5-phosphoribosyl)-5-[(5-phosphoribosylamino)methylideneamino]imidazole-4-carboxamide isomerase [Cellvibrionales bacterium]
MLIIPAIDLKDGLCVRLEQGQMDRSTVFSSEPAMMAAQWVQEGAQRLHVVDLNGAFAGAPINRERVTEITANYPQLPVQLGGGIRDLATIESYLDAGVSWVILGTQAVVEPAFVTRACRAFPDRIMVGLDAKGGLLATEGWAKVSDLQATEFARRFEQDGVSAIVYTDIARDGMLRGVNVEETRRMAQASKIPIIASGGITNMDDIRALKAIESEGVMGAITGRAIYEGTLNLERAQQVAA